MTNQTVQLTTIFVPLPPERKSAYDWAMKFMLDLYLEVRDGLANTDSCPDQRPAADR